MQIELSLDKIYLEIIRKSDSLNLSLISIMFKKSLIFRCYRIIINLSKIIRLQMKDNILQLLDSKRLNFRNLEIEIKNY